MNKALLFIAAMMCSLTAFTQDFTIDANTQKITYTEDVEIANTKGSDLFSRAETWAQSKGYVFPAQKVPTIVKCTGSFNTQYPSVKLGMQEAGKIVFDVTIKTKDGKYKYTLTNFRHEGIKGKTSAGALEQKEPACGRQQISSAGWGKIKSDAYEQIQKLIPELKNIMAGTAGGSTEEKW